MVQNISLPLITIELCIESAHLSTEQCLGGVAHVCEQLVYLQGLRQIPAFSIVAVAPTVGTCSLCRHVILEPGEQCTVDHDFPHVVITVRVRRISHAVGDVAPGPEVGAYFHHRRGVCLTIVTIDEIVVVGLWRYVLEWQLVAVGIQVAANISYLIENSSSS